MSKFKDVWDNKGFRIARRSVSAVLVAAFVGFGIYNTTKNFDENNNDINNGNIDNNSPVDTIPVPDSTKPEQQGSTPHNPVNGFDTENFTPTVTTNPVDINQYIGKDIVFNYTLVNKAGNNEIIIETTKIYTLGQCDSINKNGDVKITTITTVNGFSQTTIQTSVYSVNETNNTIEIKTPYNNNNNSEYNNTDFLYITDCLDENGNPVLDANGNKTSVIGSTVIANQISEGNVKDGLYYVTVTDHVEEDTDTDTE